MKLNIVRPFLPDISEIQESFSECLKTGMVTNNSAHVRTYEENLQQYFQSEYKPLVFNNGEMALFHLLQAWKSRLGYTSHQSFGVLVPSFTFSGSINAMVTNNLKPVFCDVNETLTIDISKVSSSLLKENDVKICLAVGVYGNLPNIDLLKDFCEQHQLVLLFDNAPAFASQYKGKFPNHYGFDEIYSFHATKIYNSMEGGAAIVHDEEMYQLLSRLREFGQYEKVRGDVDIPGLNSKMQEISAIVGNKNLEKIDFILENRKQNIALYQSFFSKMENEGFLRNMKVIPEVFCPYLYYPIILNEEATPFVQFMQDNEIAVRRYYTACHTLTCYKNKYSESDLSFTESIKDQIVSLPIHTLMTSEEIQYLFDTVARFFNT